MPRVRPIIVFLLTVFLGLFAIFGLDSHRSLFSIPVPASTKATSTKPFNSITMPTPVTHTVLLQINPEAKPEDVNAVIKEFFALKDKSVSPTTGKPYIVSIKGGKDNSPEGMQHGITHAFVVEFESVEDRDYYVKEDPAHKELIKHAVEALDKLIVVDFTDGVF